MNLFVSMLSSSFGNELMDKILGLLSIIPKFMYLLFTGILSIVDLLQLFFRSIVGLDGVVISGVNGGNAVTGDLAYNIIVEALFGSQFPAIKTAFWSMVILGLILLCVATFVANLRIEYRPDKDKGNSRNGIVKNFFKGLAYMGIIPLATIFGLYLGNVVLKAIDSATTATVSYTEEQTTGLKAYQMDDGTLTYGSYNIGITTRLNAQIPTKTTPFSSLIFRASAYSCNRARDDDNFYLSMANGGTYDKYTNVSNLGIFKKADQESSAEMIDFVFSIGAQLNNPQQLNKDAGITGIGGWLDPWDSAISGQIQYFNKNNVDLVWYYYSLIKFNWIVAFVAVIMICKIMLNLSFDMVGRLVEIIMLFLAMPVLCSLIPLDNDSIADKARKRLLSKAIMVYAAVFCLNLIYSLVPILQNFKFIVVNGVAFNVINYLINTLILIAGLKTVESLVSTFSGFIGADYDAKGSLKQSTLSAVGEGFGASLGLANATAKVGMATGKVVGKTAGLAGKVVGKTASAAFGGRHAKLEKLQNERQQRDEKYMKDFEENDPEKFNRLYQNYTMAGAGSEGRRIHDEAKQRLIDSGIANPTQEQIKKEVMKTDEFKNYAQGRSYEYVDSATYDKLDDKEKAKYANREEYLQRQREEREKIDREIAHIRDSKKYKFEKPFVAGAGFIKKAGRTVGNAGRQAGHWTNEHVLKPVSRQVTPILSLASQTVADYGSSVQQATHILDVFSPIKEQIQESLKQDDKKDKKGKH